jgi:hypothetical protein
MEFIFKLNIDNKTFFFSLIFLKLLVSTGKYEQKFIVNSYINYEYKY